MRKSGKSCKRATEFRCAVRGGQRRRRAQGSLLGGSLASSAVDAVLSRGSALQGLRSAVQIGLKEICRLGPSVSLARASPLMQLS